MTRLLQKLTAAGSILCTVNCSLLPAITVASSVSSSIPASSAAMLHTASHYATWYFVAPFGLYSMVDGYRKHKKGSVLATGTAGLSMLLASHSHTIAHDVLQLTSSQGIGLSLAGCALFMTAQWKGQRLLKEMQMTCCAHKNKHA
jgi:hypothetical protein